MLFRFRSTRVPKEAPSRLRYLSITLHIYLGLCNARDVSRMRPIGKAHVSTGALLRTAHNSMGLLGSTTYNRASHAIAGNIDSGICFFINRCPLYQTLARI